MKRFLFCMAFAVAGCGGAAPAAEAPSQKGAAPESVQQSVEASPDANHTDANTRGVAGARSEFQNAEARVAAATGDCATACRALASMERAAEHLCAMTDQSECDRAHKRLEDAREHVRSSCGGCQ